MFPAFSGGGARAFAVPYFGCGVVRNRFPQCCGVGAQLCLSITRGCPGALVTAGLKYWNCLFSCLFSDVNSCYVNKCPFTLNYSLFPNINFRLHFTSMAIYFLWLMPVRVFGWDCILLHYFHAELTFFINNQYEILLFQKSWTKKRIHCRYFWTKI